MLEQARDFREECDALFTLLNTVGEHEWERKTQFKDWTLNDILAHLHFGDYAADVSLQGNEKFNAFVRKVTAARQQGLGHLAFTHAWLGGTKSQPLLRRWYEFAQAMADRFAVADPKMRVLWFGPDMSVRSSITARLMETWAHAQVICWEKRDTIPIVSRISWLLASTPLGGRLPIVACRYQQRSHIYDFRHHQEQVGNGTQQPQTIASRVVQKNFVRLSPKCVTLPIPNCK